MPRHEHGVYEPSSDDIRVFDGGEDEIDDEGSRLPLLIAIALLVLAAFGGVVWLAYSQGVQRGREGATQVITAQQGPVRTKPANPGGKTPFEGLKIYEQPAPPQEQSAPAHSAPPPAAPKPSTSQVSASKAHEPALRESAKAPHAKPEAPKPAKAKPAPMKSAPVKAKPATKPAPVKTATHGGYTLQIGAYKSQGEARTAWKAYQRKHSIVGGYAPDILRVDLGSKGVWYRLRIGSFDKAGASKLCAKLKADGGGCFLAKK